MSNSQKSLVLISGYYGFGNLGDEAILESIISELEKTVSKENIVVLSNDPERHRKTFGVTAVDRWKLGFLSWTFAQSKSCSSAAAAVCFRTLIRPAPLFTTAVKSHWHARLVRIRSYLPGAWSPQFAKAGKVATQLAAKLSKSDDRSGQGVYGYARKNGMSKQN